MFVLEYWPSAGQIERLANSLGTLHQHKLVQLSCHPRASIVQFCSLLSLVVVSSLCRNQHQLHASPSLPTTATCPLPVSSRSRRRRVVGTARPAVAVEDLRGRAATSPRLEGRKQAAVNKLEKAERKKTAETSAVEVAAEEAKEEPAVEEATDEEVEEAEDEEQAETETQSEAAVRQAQQRKGKRKQPAAPAAPARPAQPAAKKAKLQQGDRIDKDKTNPIFIGIEHYDSLRLYVSAANHVFNEGKEFSDSSWKTAIEDKFEVSSTMLALSALCVDYYSTVSRLYAHCYCTA